MTINTNLILNDNMNSKYVDICAKFQKILFNPRAAKWMSYEWSYDDLDNAFFNETSEFEQYMAEFFPKLKTKRLTRSEWRRIRKYVSLRHKRRFSAKYLRGKRNELREIWTEKISPEHSNDAKCAVPDHCDLAANVINSSSSTSGDTQSSSEVSPECESETISSQSNSADYSDSHLFRLLIETSNHLSRKAVILGEIKELMQGGTAVSHITTQTAKSEIVGSLIMELYNINVEILAKFEKLWNFHQVKATLLFNSTTRITTDYFHQKCQLAILQKFQQLEMDALNEYPTLTAVTESLLTLVYMLKNCECHTKESFTKVLAEEMKKLKMHCGNEFATFEEELYPQLMLLFKKSAGTKQDAEKSIMQYIN